MSAKFSLYPWGFSRFHLILVFVVLLKNYVVFDSSYLCRCFGCHDVASYASCLLISFGSFISQSRSCRLLNFVIALSVKFLFLKFVLKVCFPMLLDFVGTKRTCLGARR